MAVNDAQPVTGRIMVMLERPADWPADRMWTDIDASVTARVGSVIASTMAVGGEQVPLDGEYVVTGVRIVDGGQRLMVVAERRTASARRSGDAPALGWTDWSQRDNAGRISEELLPGEPPEHRAARSRADDEEERIAARYATGGVIEGPGPGDDRIPVVLTGCLNGQYPTDEQHAAAIERLKAKHAAQVARAHDGQGVLPMIGES